MTSVEGVNINNTVGAILLDNPTMLIIFINNTIL
jgi:hypothetical protein